jgi:hypothetical protein
VGAGSPWGSGFGSEGNASEFGSAYGFMQVMARARGLDNGLFKAWGSRGELPRAALAAPRAGEDTRGARLEAGASSRARGRQRVRQRRQCQCIRQRVLVHAGHGMGAGLGQWTFQGGKTQLSRERDVHGAHVDACTVYLLRVLIMAAIPP